MGRGREHRQSAIFPNRDSITAGTKHPLAVCNTVHHHHSPTKCATLATSYMSLLPVAWEATWDDMMVLILSAPSADYRGLFCVGRATSGRSEPMSWK
jgi:hypothetical protein